MNRSAHSIGYCSGNTKTRIVRVEARSVENANGPLLSKLLVALLLAVLLSGSLGLTMAQQINKKHILQSDQIINTHQRNTVLLDGTWQIIIDPYQTGYYD